MPSHNASTIFLRGVSTNEVMSEIIEVKDNEDGTDEISAEVLKSLARFIIAPFKYIFNLCIQN